MEQFIELENLQTSIFTIASRSNTNDLHIHEVAQLSVPENGIIYSVVQEQLYVIPPTVAIYIPANTPHYIYKTNNNIIIENIYFSEKYFNLLPQITKEISLTDLTKILITQLCKIPGNQLDNNKAQQMLHLLLTELNENNNSPKYNLKIPTNESLKKIFNHIAKNDLNSLPNLDDCARVINVSKRTLQRIIQQL